MKNVIIIGNAEYQTEIDVIEGQLKSEGHTVTKADVTSEQDCLKEDDKALILASDGIFVVDVDNNVNDIVQAAIDYAEHQGRFVKYLSRFPDLIYLCDYALLTKK